MIFFNDFCKYIYLFIIILDAKGFVFDSATAVQTIAKDPTWEDMVIFKYIFERSNTYMHVAYIDDNFVYLFYKFR